MAALSDIEVELHRIPPRSLDLNPTGNVFRLVKNRLAHETLTIKIERETFEKFKQRVFRVFHQTSDIKGRGSQTKY